MINNNPIRNEGLENARVPNQTTPVAAMDAMAFRQFASQDAQAQGRRQEAGPPLSFSELGELSERFESNGDPGTVSSGIGDFGGVSYGKFQFATNTGSAQRFVDFLQREHPEFGRPFEGLRPGSPAFSDAWRAVAARDPEGFGRVQTNYIGTAFFEPAKERVENSLPGLDFDSRSKALNQTLWSTAVQFGPGGAERVFDNALAGRSPARLSDAEIISSVFDERGRRNASGELVWFTGSSRAVQEGVAARFEVEERQALATLSTPSGLGPIPNGLILPGDRGEGVRNLQSALTELGFDTRGVDGIFGPNSQSALSDFQRSAGLTADGVFGPASREALLAEAGPARPREPEPVAPETPVEQPPVRQPEPTPAAEPSLAERLESQLPRGILRQGDTGIGDVGQLQLSLRALGQDAGVANGIFNNPTRQALEGFQRAAGITVDGIFGPQTRAAMIEAARNPDQLQQPSLAERLESRLPQGILRQGDTGIEDVGQLQLSLRALGHDPGVANGIFNSETRNALIDFQRSAGIAVDGVFGPQSRAAMIEAARNGDSAKPEGDPPQAVDPALGERLDEQLPKRILRQGDQGIETVGQLQLGLRALGHDPGVANGIFNTPTREALVAFQREAGITADGVFGPQTRNALVRAGGGEPSPFGPGVINRDLPPGYLSENFKVSDVNRSATAARLGIDNTPTGQALDNLRNIAQNVLEPLREEFGPLPITSGFRSEQLNNAVGGSPTSQHRTGEAIDIGVMPGIDFQDIMRFMIDSGIPFDQAIDERNHLHISLRADGNNRFQPLVEPREGVFVPFRG